MIKTVKEFKLWRAYFCYSPNGKSAIQVMKRLQQGENEFPYGNLESSVLSTCFLAAKYIPEKDHMDSHRRIGGLQLPMFLAKRNSKTKLQNVGRNSLILHLSSSSLQSFEFLYFQVSYKFLYSLNLLELVY